MGRDLSGNEGISVLVFGLCGYLVGIDTDQIGGVVDRTAVDENTCKLLAMHELLGLEDVQGSCAKAIYAKGGYFSDPSEYLWLRNEQHVALLVNTPEAIVEVALRDLRPLPEAVHHFAYSRGFWAVAMLSGEMLFMLDIRKMISGKTAGVMWVK